VDKSERGSVLTLYGMNLPKNDGVIKGLELVFGGAIEAGDYSRKQRRPFGRGIEGETFILICNTLRGESLDEILLAGCEEMHHPILRSDPILI
jgi:hypothetical protein